jgi:hypothetical protein
VLFYIVPARRDLDRSLSDIDIIRTKHQKAFNSTKRSVYDLLDEEDLEDDDEEEEEDEDEEDFSDLTGADAVEIKEAIEAA